ncbi:9345_t:CDS:2, partial [Diversispora eburnea]
LNEANNNFVSNNQENESLGLNQIESKNSSSSNIESENSSSSNQKNENLNFINDGYSTRSFQNNYPISTFIKAQYITGNKIFDFWYNVISLEHYLIFIKLTQKNFENYIQYQISDNYCIETKIYKIKIHCETKYQLNSKVKFTIVWKENRAEYSIYSDRSVTNIVNIFLKIYQYLISIKKRLLATIQIISGQNKRFASLGRESEKIIKSLIEKNQMTIKKNQPIVSLQKIERLAAVKSYFTREYSIANRKVEITNLINEKIRINTFNIDKNEEDLYENLNNLKENNENIDNIIVDEIEIRNGVYRSTHTLLQNLIKIWKQSSFINLGDILKLKLDGDSRNVG